MAPCLLPDWKIGDVRVWSMQKVPMSEAVPRTAVVSDPGILQLEAERRVWGWSLVASLGYCACGGP
jgi:hypothetical protein